MKKLTQEHKDAIGRGNKGKKRTPEFISLMSKARKGKPLFKRRGIKHSEETKKHLSSFWKGKRKGIEHPRWKGGYENHLWHSRQRRAKLFNVGGVHSLNEWELLKTQYNWTCPCCLRSEPEIKLTADHIIPLIKGGSNNIENIQPLCKSCNSTKHDKFIRYKLPL